MNKSQDENTPMEHNYDGIKEYDNMLPRWWIQIFYATIIFSAGYLFYYHLGGNGKSHNQTFEEELALQKLQEAAQPSSKVEFSMEDLAPLKNNPQKLAEGKAIYLGKCAACHGAGGEGNIGPNLTDDYWLHGGKANQIASTVYNGVVEKGMVAWGSLMSKDEVLSVSNYVASLRGSSPVNPKAPQGNKEAP